ncbi:MAG: transcriptional repressor [Treponema sp.]|nr:transcriptional repressor [Treponema sp.]
MPGTERKYSKQREAILRMIRSTASHPSARWVYEHLRPVIPGLSLGTVYRNINLFLEEGSVVSIGIVEGEERFDGSVMPHPHCICTGCGAVLDLPGTLPLDYGIDLPRSEGPVHEGFQIDYQKTVFYGRCSRCINT